MEDRSTHELKILIAFSDALTARVHEIAKGTRFQRSPERANQLYQKLRRARQNVESAVQCLDADTATEASEGRDQKSGWLRLKIASLTKNLIGGFKSTDDEQESTDGKDGFHGDSWAIPIPDLLNFLQIQGKSGILRVSLETEVIYIEFNDGDLVHAYSDNPPIAMRLGEILVAQGAIDSKRLESFLFCYSKSQGMIGEALKRGELVDEKQLEKAVDFQVQQLFHRIFQVENATYHFRECEPELTHNANRRNVTSLLLESARAVDEASPERYADNPSAPLPSQADTSPDEAQRA